MRSIGCLRMGMRALIGHMQASTAADLNDSSKLKAVFHASSGTRLFALCADVGERRV